MTSLLMNVLLAIPFWICWTVGGIGEQYFSFLPEAWHSIPLGNVVGLFISGTIVKVVFVPSIITVSRLSVAEKSGAGAEKHSSAKIAYRQWRRRPIAAKPVVAPTTPAAPPPAST